jgi:hypothetical protein
MLPRLRIGLGNRESRQTRRTTRAVSHGSDPHMRTLLTPVSMSCPGTCTFIPQRPVTRFIGLDEASQRLVPGDQLIRGLATSRTGEARGPPNCSGPAPGTHVRRHDHSHENCTQGGELPTMTGSAGPSVARGGPSLGHARRYVREHVVDLVVRVRHFDRNLGEVIRMGPR